MAIHLEHCLCFLGFNIFDKDKQLVFIGEATLSIWWLLFNVLLINWSDILLNLFHIYIKDWPDELFMDGVGGDRNTTNIDDTRDSMVIFEYIKINNSSKSTKWVINQNYLFLFWYFLNNTSNSLRLFLEWRFFE